jgi:sialidase-1
MIQRTCVAVTAWLAGTALFIATAATSRGVETFEAAPAGPLANLESAVGRWTAPPGDAEIHDAHAREGRKSLRLLGGTESTCELTLPEPLGTPARLSFWAERWTAAGPFSFTIEAADTTGRFARVHDAGSVKIGGFLTRVEARIPAGTARLRFRATTPPDKGVMIDDLALEPEGPMRLLGATATRPACPVLVRKPVNPVAGIAIRTAGTSEPLVLRSLSVSLEGTTAPADVATVSLATGGADPSGPFTAIAGFRATREGRLVRFTGSLPLQSGDTWVWVVVALRDGADIDGLITATVASIDVSGQDVPLTTEGPAGQRVGVAMRLRGEDGSDTYRIPGLVRTKAGSLLAAYDVRYRGGADLPADIDVGTSRSTDGGRSWEPMRIALDMGRDARFGHDGVGDPCIFVDAKTGRIHIAALWSHGRRGWHGSGPGMTPDETGQLVMATSDDDGRTWSKPRNITAEVKKPEWRLILAGPGTGITLRDGTLVFPAQFKDAANVPHSSLIWSKDHGTTWHMGTGVKPKTTECQLVELADGAIMINCRDDRGGARTVAVTRDLGATWDLHPTDRKALPESVCMASLLALDVPGGGRRLLFSNPATTSGRHTMTIKVSADEGLTWPVERHTLYDGRKGLGYSCLAPVDDAHVGVLYEGLGELSFVRFPLVDLLGPFGR